MHKMAVTLKWLVALGYVSRWMKAAEENINESAHVTVLVPAQTKQISPWNQAYLERWDNNRNLPQVHAACERWMGAKGTRRGAKSRPKVAFLGVTLFFWEGGMDKKQLGIDFAEAGV